MFTLCPFPQMSNVVPGMQCVDWSGKTANL